MSSKGLRDDHGLSGPKKVRNGVSGSVSPIPFPCHSIHGQREMSVHSGLLAYSLFRSASSGLNFPDSTSVMRLETMVRTSCKRFGLGTIRKRVPTKDPPHSLIGFLYIAGARYWSNVVSGLRTQIVSASTNITSSNSVSSNRWSFVGVRCMASVRATYAGMLVSSIGPLVYSIRSTSLTRSNTHCSATTPSADTPLIMHTRDDLHPNFLAVQARTHAVGTYSSPPYTTVAIARRFILLVSVLFWHTIRTHGFEGKRRGGGIVVGRKDA